MPLPQDPNAITHVFDPSTGNIVPVDPTQALVSNPAPLNNMLAPFGVQMPQHINPNVALPDNSFFQRHARLGAALDGAILGAAFTRPSETPGEAISNVAQGLIQANQARRSNTMQQLMAPFGIAEQGAKLQSAQDEHKLSGAHAMYYTGRANIERTEAKNPYADVKAANDGYLYGIRKDNGAFELIPNQPKPLFTNANEKTEFERQIAGLEQERVAAGGPPFSATEKWNMYLKLSAQRAGAAGAGSASGRFNAESNQPGYLSTVDRLNFETNLGNARNDISQREQELRSLDNPKTAFTLYGNSAAIQNRRTQLKAEIDSFKKALNAYPNAFSSNPALTFDDHLNNIQNGVVPTLPNPYRPRRK